LLSEREEELRDTKAAKSRLEIEAEGFEQRMKTLDESEHRYKDENWNLETQIHELIAAQKDGADREKKLTQTLNILQAEKNTTQRELDEVKLNLSKLDDKHTAAVKQHDIELGTAKRKEVMAESEKVSMQKKIEDLTSQNHELAKAISSARGRTIERDAMLGMSDEDFETGQEAVTPEHSPPPSPIKGTPRHSMLESETLKTSLQHAQRTIQSLRTNVHREKTEKLELKRLLQEARDELEKTRNDPGLSHKRSRKLDSKQKLSSSQLGASRSSKSEIYLDDPEWEDHAEASPAHARKLGESGTDQFDTAHETSDAAFETANERGTETDDFHTGAEDLSDDGAATETEATPSKGVRSSGSRPQMLPIGTSYNRLSFQSTASTSNDEEDYEGSTADVKTPTSPPPQKMRLRVSRGAMNRRRQMSEDPTFQSSPASFATESATGTPQPAGQSLFAELGDFDGSDDESNIGGATPSRRSLRSVQSGLNRQWTASPAPEVPALPPKAPMVDSGMMTEPVEVRPALAVVTHRASIATDTDGLLSPQSVVFLGRPKSDASTQWLGDEWTDGVQSRPLSSISYSDAGAQHDPDILAKFPSPPTSPSKSAELSLPIVPPSLSLSTILHSEVEPRDHVIIPPALKFSSVMSQEVQPVAEKAPPVPVLALSSVRSEQVEPLAERVPTPVELSFATIRAEEVQPVKEPEIPPPILAFSALHSQHTEPISPKAPSIIAPELGFVPIQSVESEPIEPRSPKRDAFIIPRDEDLARQLDSEAPKTPTNARFGSIMGWSKGKGKSKAPESPIIAEDDTRQSLNATPVTATPESQRPLKEVSGNTDVRPPRKAAVETADHGAQTSLTAEAIDAMMLAKSRALGHEKQDSFAGTVSTPGTVRRHRSKESWDSIGLQDAARPGSSASGRGTIQDVPPLPPNHREAIEAARSGSSHGQPGSMGPPLYPASAYRNQNPLARPRTPVEGRFSSVAGTPTPRAGRPTSRATDHSRKSSVSSFASEIDTRFNMHQGMAFNPSGAGFGPNTDPRMIQAITQTMIGEYLWKYTRKTGRGEMSENRHRRFFWVHPYTRTLYWSDRDPSMAGRSEIKTKSVPIEAVRVVTDDNPFPPGLHRKSLIVISPGRSVKFTCTTGQRHETWLNALSYLLLRTGDEDGMQATPARQSMDDDSAVGDSTVIITHEDVEEFNPQLQQGRQRTTGSRTRPPPPPSLSSYNSRRRARNESAAVDLALNMPTLTQTPAATPQKASRPSFGTLGRLSGRWKDSSFMSGFGSLRSRSVNAQARSPYEGPDQAHDSAEDVRIMIEQQDREASRLENVRACCDGKCPPSLSLVYLLWYPTNHSLPGKHDVGHLHQHSKRGRHGHSHQHQHAHFSSSQPQHLDSPTTPTRFGTVRSNA
jgi:hypothetical protein